MYVVRWHARVRVHALAPMRTCASVCAFMRVCVLLIACARGVRICARAPVRRCARPRGRAARAPSRRGRAALPQREAPTRGGTRRRSTKTGLGTAAAASPSPTRLTHGVSGRRRRRRRRRVCECVRERVDACVRACVSA
eukprot:2991472-Pleurochrysis_carterae.AAC.1